jgi:very-short-patch-repair endonuclease
MARAAPGRSAIPQHERVQPLEVCAGLGGIARTRQLAAAGISKRRLRVAVAEGSVLRLREGVYAAPSADEAVIHAVRHGGRLACVDALRWHGLWVLHDDRFHVALQPNGRHHDHASCDATLQLHWDTPAVETGRAVEVESALVQLSHCGTEEALLVAVESALASCRPTLDGRGLARLRALVAEDKRPLLSFASGASESGLETLVRWRLHQLGIECRQQVHVPGVGRVDLVVGDRLIIELDGHAHHSTEAAFASDRRRDAAAAAIGFVVLRFSYAQVMHEWPHVAAAVTTTITGGLHETEAGRRLRAGCTR